MENPKVSKKLKTGCGELYNIQGCSLVGNLEASKKSVKLQPFVVLYTRVQVICHYVHILFLGNFQLAAIP